MYVTKLTQRLTMKSLRLVFISILLVTSAVSFSCVPRPVTLQKSKAAYPDPDRFENEIQTFEAEDKISFPPPGAIVCIGSSSMRMWRSIREDMAPLTVIHRGFGGSSMNDALYFSDRIIIQYHPRAILLSMKGITMQP